MSDVIQVVLNSKSQGASAPAERSDAGSEGFAQLFEQQMARVDPAEPVRRSEGAPDRADEGGDRAPAAREEPREERAVERPEVLPQAGLQVSDPVRAQAAATAQPLRTPQEGGEKAPALDPGEPVSEAPLRPAQPAAPQTPSTVEPTAAAGKAVATQVPAQVAAAEAHAPRQARNQPEAPAPKPAVQIEDAPTVKPAPSDPVARIQTTLSAEEAAPAAPAPERQTGGDRFDPRAFLNLETEPQAEFPLPETGLPLERLGREGLAPLANPVLLGTLAPGTVLQAAATAPAGAEGVTGPAAPGTPGGGSVPTRGTALAPRASQAEMIERLVATAKMLTSGRGEKTFLLRLQPPELGPLRVRLQMDGDVVNLRILTTETGRHAILQNLDHLKQALLDQGLQLGRFDVGVDSQDGSATPFAREQQEGSRRRNPEDALADSLLAAPGMDPRSERREEEAGEVLVSDAMAVDLLA